MKNKNNYSEKFNEFVKIFDEQKCIKFSKILLLILLKDNIKPNDIKCLKNTNEVKFLSNTKKFLNNDENIKKLIEKNNKNFNNIMFEFLEDNIILYFFNIQNSINDELNKNLEFFKECINEIDSNKINVFIKYFNIAFIKIYTYNLFLNIEKNENIITYLNNENNSKTLEFIKKIIFKLIIEKNINDFKNKNNSNLNNSIKKIEKMINYLNNDNESKNFKLIKNIMFKIMFEKKINNNLNNFINNNNL